MARKKIELREKKSSLSLLSKHQLEKTVSVMLVCCSTTSTRSTRHHGNTDKELVIKVGYVPTRA